jgi:hypothetical protein
LFSRGVASYAIAFLSVMSLFALGNLMLKFKRNQLKREVKATWTQTFIALAGVFVALFGNIIMNPDNLLVFLWYFFAMAVLVFGMYRPPPPCHVTVFRQ